MKRIAVTAVVMAVSVAVQAADTSPSEWKRSEVYVVGVTDIDVQGKVEHVDLLPVRDRGSKVLADQLAPLIKSTIAHWEFVPATENGKPAPAHTFVHGVVEFRPKGQDYEARYVYIGNGPEIEEPTAPKYPRDMIEERTQATLNMLVLVQPDGQLTDVHLESATSTDGKRVGQFLVAAKEAMSSWHAQPEMVDGHPVKTWVRVPISFDLRSNVNQLRYDPELKRSIDSPAAPPKDSAGDQAMALDSRIKLKPQSP